MITLHLLVDSAPRQEPSCILSLTTLPIEKHSLPLQSEKAFFSIMQKKTDKGISLVSKSLPVANSNSVNRLFSARKK